MLMLSSCATVVHKPRIADAAPPGPPRRTTVSFAPLFEGRLNSNSVYAGKDADLMRRVLLSPNLVFESSRSSVDEPKTIGPAKATERTPWLPDALGEPIDIQLSSMLMNYLSAPPRNSILLAPALTKKWDPAFWCIGTKDCVEASWVERLILMHMKAPTTKDGKEAPSAISKQEELPSSAFAVRRLGAHLVTTRVVASRTSNGDLEFRPRRSDDEPSVCAEASLTYPVVQFQAELVSLRDGRLLARIDETRSPQLSAETRRQIQATEWIPARATEYESFEQEYSGARLVPIRESEYSYVERYTEHGVECQNALNAYGALLEDIKRKFEGFTLATATELFKATIDPLYVNQVTIAPPPAPAPAIIVAPEPPPIAPPVPTAAPLKPPEAPASPVACNSNAECKGGRCRNHVCVPLK